MNIHTHTNIPSRQVSALHTFPLNVSRGYIIGILTKKGARNASGLPLTIYRSDLIPDWSSGLTNAQLESCAMPLNFSESFASFADGQPIWSKMPHESPHAYELMQHYINQRKEYGIRQIYRLKEDTKTSALVGNLSFEELQDLSKEFYWVDRAKAFDLFEETSYQSHRILKIKSMENAHYDVADKLMAKILSVFDDVELIEQMSAKEAFGVFVDLIKVQRQSLGMSGQGGSPAAMQVAPGQSVEAIFRQVTQVHGHTDDGGTTADRLSQILNSDPKTALAAQELILRVNGAVNDASGNNTEAPPEF